MLHFALIKSYEQVPHFNALVQRIWGTENDDIPVHVLVTIAKNGGGILLAKADDGPPELDGAIGATLWWLGVQKPRGEDMFKIKACSHMAGVLPGRQGQGIGRQLKLKQRELILEQGVTDWMTWTYDPLYCANGVFNLHHLGAVCDTYARNVYGELNDDLNRGTPSDRCQVDWWMRSERVEQAASGKLPNDEHAWHDTHILPSTIREDGFIQPVEEIPTYNSLVIAVPLPADIGAIRRADVGLGHAWRMYMRAVLESAFATGYRMTDCVNHPSAGWHYILTHHTV